jgi:hypothetical protein
VRRSRIQRRRETPGLRRPCTTLGGRIRFHSIVQ